MRANAREPVPGDSAERQRAMIVADHDNLRTANGSRQQVRSFVEDQPIARVDRMQVRGFEVGAPAEVGEDVGLVVFGRRLHGTEGNGQ
ncbi:hypothetical protein CXY01_34030 [Cellulomonas xylanilytica]|uniref:Uncharacterized protein n=1 Tax=Cellulomonas xylanilytica TaxID=233583 RepID=A0A510V7P1_9CELL|nr:hypothetical protein CXY01_34030 [Cellulomonas xylanilytica]